jgi:elongation factor Ts
MAEISAALVKQLRDRTGAGMMDSKRALVEVDGDIEKAVDVLRARGVARAAGKATRIASEGIVASYLHNSGSGAKLGVLVELNCESDFVAKTDDFHGLAREVALQVAGANPRWVRRADVPTDVVERERAIYREQVKDKPANIVDKIVDGKLEAWYAETVLADQPWIRDKDKRFDELIKEGIAKLGENISVARFARFLVGEAAANGAATADATAAE